MGELKYFKNSGERVYVQALRAWLVLGAHVQNKRKLGAEDALITYGDLADAMCMSRRAGRTLARPLWIIGAICLQNGLPALNVIVINAKELEPGSGVLHHSTRTVTEEQKLVAAYDWFSVRPPTTGMLRRVWESLDNEEED